MGRAIPGIRKVTNRIARLFNELHDVVRKVKILLWILDSFSDLEMFLCLQQSIDDHVLYGICYRSANEINERFSCWRMEKRDKLTSLVVVYALVQAEPHVAQLIKLIRVFDVVTNLIVDDSSGCKEPIGFRI